MLTTYSYDVKRATVACAMVVAVAALGATPPSPADATAILATHYTCTASASAITLPNGTAIPYDDGKTKTTEQRIDAPDVEDVFALGYRTGPIVAVSDAQQDPGRIRIEPLFRATYGADAAAVSAQLVPVKFAGHSVSFHKRAAPALGRVAARIDGLLRADPSLAKYFKDLGGTFNPRLIAGTTHASAHSWGMAIDIDTTYADYWRNGVQPPVWRNRIPQSIVDAFEAEGFVWGGRWFHYDTMHFEWRPELFDRRTATSPMDAGAGSSGIQ